MERFEKLLKLDFESCFDRFTYAVWSCRLQRHIFPADCDVFLEDFREKISKIIVIEEGEEEKERKRRFSVL